MVELRILGKRTLRLPDDFGDASALIQLGPGYASLLVTTINLGLRKMQIVHGDTYWAPPPVRFSGRLKRDPDHSQIAVRQAVEDHKIAPSERLRDEKKVLDELIVQIGKPLGPTMEEIERIRQFPNHNYSETVRKYEDLLSHLKERMRYALTLVSVISSSCFQRNNCASGQNDSSNNQAG